MQNFLKHLYDSRGIIAENKGDVIIMHGKKNGVEYSCRDESAIVALLGLVFKMDGGVFNFQEETHE